jgi:hypothetical protein
MSTEKIQKTFEILETLEKAFTEAEGYPENDFDKFKESIRQAVVRRLLEKLKTSTLEPENAHNEKES